MTKGALLAFKVIGNHTSLEEFVIECSSEVNVIDYDDPTKTKLSLGGDMKMPSKEFGEVVARLDAKETATYKDSNYKAPTMRNNLRKGKKHV